MSALTTRRSLYLFGGGSDGLYGADEIMDVSKINQSFVKIDGDLYPSAASVAALVLLTNVPVGAVVSVQQYDTGGGRLHHRSIWQYSGGGTWVPLSDLQFYVGSVADLITAATTISGTTGVFIPNGFRAMSGQNGTIVRWNGTTWRTWSADGTAGIAFAGTVTSRSAGETRVSREGRSGTIMCSVGVGANGVAVDGAFFTVPDDYAPVSGGSQNSAVVLSNSYAVVGMAHIYLDPADKKLKFGRFMTGGSTGIPANSYVFATLNYQAIE